jgi:hypothetical protein
MKEALVHAGPRVELKESPIPTPNASQVVIKVVFSSTNPKDWKVCYPFPTREQKSTLKILQLYPIVRRMDRQSLQLRRRYSRDSPRCWL